MYDEHPKNILVGLTSADTLDNVSAVISLLLQLNFEGDINEYASAGLYLIHTLMKDALLFEITRVGQVCFLSVGGDET